MNRNLCKSTSLQLVRRGHAPKIVSRRFQGSNDHRSASYLTDAPPAPAGPDADKRSEEELLTAIDARIEKALASRATKEELQAIREARTEELKGLSIESLRAMADDKTGVMSMIAAQGLEIQRLETQMARLPEDNSIRAQITKWQKANKENIDAIRSGTKQGLSPLELRLDSPMSVATVNPTGSTFIGRVEVAPGINDFIRIRPTFWDFIVKGRTNAPTYVWVNKTNPEGEAAFIGPGVPKPGVSFELIAESSIAKKIADSAKATTELLEDIDGMQTFIEQELRYKVMIKVNSTLMLSAGSSTVPKGIRNYSVAYTTTTIKTTNATHADAIRAVVGQLRSGLLEGEITVFINPIDEANMDLAKATDSGVYLLPPFVTADGRVIAGARVISDYNVPVGFVQAGFMRFYRILIYKDFSVTWGWENDDFTRNLVTAVGEMRLHEFVNSIHTGAFIYDSFVNIKALVNTP